MEREGRKGGAGRKKEGREGVGDGGRMIGFNTRFKK